jgi:hypothetical protein
LLSLVNLLIKMHRYDKYIIAYRKLDNIQKN